eukprot:m.273956 g.273956  ORF g.273956 m.273956 type:complete len:384 (-) comp16284_c1_seq1:25-1176(-)
MVFVALLYCFSVMGLAETGTITINVAYCNGNDKMQISSMFLRGNGLGLSWNNGMKMDQSSASHWSLQLQYNQTMTGRILQVKAMLMDTHWQIGNNTYIQLNGGIQSVELYPWFFNTQGDVTVWKENLFSPQLKNFRGVALYLPPSYKENTCKQYSKVLVMQDGNNVFDLQCPSCCPNGCWQSEQTINALINEGAMEEVIVVGVFNTPARLSEYTYCQDPEFPQYPAKADQYIEFLEQTVLPALEQDVRLAVDYNKGILGSSLGGLLSCYAAWKRPQVWQTVGCMSSSFWWNNEDYAHILLKNGTASPLPGQDSVKIYLDSGTEGSGKDDMVETITVRSDLEKIGKTIGNSLFYYLDVGGSHNEQSWGKRFWKPMVSLYPNPIL